ncbi:MAG TPA: ABC-type transport auxiliary lipoprotein family protein [Bryobacteraceae bacterium]|nr:ABC-type transport auxiliary lipoprotein family protein [Bryobacteraceae bacterium]
MHRAFLTISISMIGWGLAGCGSPKPVKYYTLQIPAAPASSVHNSAIDLVVSRVSGSDLLEASPIVYKMGTHEIGTYSYHHWTGAPTEMVQEKLIRLLRRSGEFRSVVGSESKTGGTAKGDGLVLRGRLYEFSEVDGDSVQGLVTMEFELYNQSSSKVVWTHFYSQSEPVTTKAVTAVVQAIDHNLDRGLNEVVDELNKYLTANPPGKS